MKAIDGQAHILKDNIRFCQSCREAGDTYTELKDLAKEALASGLGWEQDISSGAFGKAVGKSAMLTYLSFVLLPLSYGILFDFLAGNLVASFMQARTLLEQLAKCFLADIEEMDESFFQERLRFIEKSRSIAKSVESLGLDALQLWGKLSDDWVHMKRLEKLVTAVSQRGIPSYGIIVPIVYDTEDIPDTVELNKCIRTLRGLLEDTVQRWNATSRYAANADGKPYLKPRRQSREASEEPRF